MVDIGKTCTSLVFLVRLVNLLLALACLITWCVETDKQGNQNGMNPFKFSQGVLFAHTVPAYVVVLCVLVIGALLEEEIGKWQVRLYMGAGAILFFVTGVIACMNYNKGYCMDMGRGEVCGEASLNALVVGILCFPIVILMLVDLAKNENLF